jgi:cell division cycle protein 20 (cofactor of APC complex)
MAPYHQILTLILIGLLSSLLSPCAYAMPSPSYQRRSSLNVEVVDRLELRDGPTFPEQPPSCPICEQNYESIDSCALAAPVLANFTMVYAS